MPVATAVAACIEASDRTAVAAEAARAFCSCPAGSASCWAGIKSLTAALPAGCGLFDLVEARLLDRYGLLIE